MGPQTAPSQENTAHFLMFLVFLSRDPGKNEMANPAADKTIIREARGPRVANPRHRWGVMLSCRSGAEKSRRGIAPRDAEFQDQSRKAGNSGWESRRPRHTKPALASGAVFRTNPVGRNICRRPERPAVPVRVARDTPEFCEWRPEDESLPSFLRAQHPRC
jgi:hypothetical protein